MRSPLAALALLLALGAPLAAGTPPELGAVRWIRDFDEASARCRETGRFMLLLFNEVPG